MLFPLPKLWSENPIDDAVAKIDRHLADRSQRLSAGLSVGSEFEMVHGVLLVTRGRGKYLRVDHIASAQTSIPDSISDSLRQLMASSASNITELAQAKSDLAEIQAQLTEQIKVQAGKYVDRLLIVGVNDPGYWSRDFDGQVFYSSMCDRHQLAELSGLNVIDAFPARDLAVGGTGELLQALPLWFLLADRNPRISNNYVALLRFDSETHVYLLPPSDGLDAEIPDIKCFRLPGIGFIQKLLKILSPNSDVDHFDMVGLYVDGQRIPGLFDLWNEGLSTKSNRILERSKIPAELDWDEDKLITATLAYLDIQACPIASVVRSAFAFIVELIKSQIKHQAGVSPKERKHLDRIWISATEDTQAAIINQVRQIFKHSEIETTTTLGLTESKLSAATAALMGLMHVDQMACNIPWLTGAESMRSLGQLTPGRPSNWRQLVMDMADFQPPAMRLRDAV